MEDSLGVWDPSVQAELEQSVKCALKTLTEIFCCLLKKGEIKKNNNKKQYIKQYAKKKKKSKLTSNPEISLTLSLS